jgi:hypothetical protein
VCDKSLNTFRSAKVYLPPVLTLPYDDVLGFYTKAWLNVATLEECMGAPDLQSGRNGLAGC